MRLFWSFLPQKTVAIEVADDIAKIKMKRHFAARYKPGQYVMINFPSVSLFQWHPFTLSNGENEKWLEVYIRGLGNFSKRVVAKAAEAGDSPMWVRVDGPYGRHKFDFRRYPSVILAAAGIGVTPVISILKTIYDIDALENDEENEPNSSTANRKAPHTSHVYLLWTVRSAAQLALFVELFAGIKKQASSGHFAKFSALVNISQPTEEQRESAAQSVLTEFETATAIQTRPGRPDVRSDLSDIFQEIHTNADDLSSHRTAIFACGPTKFVNNIWDESNKANLTGSLPVDFHYEAFKF